jgi:hypothetical protein
MESDAIATSSNCDGDIVPADVWWGDEGIDALIWADGRPYDGLTNMPTPVCEDPMTGGVQ